MCVCENKNNNNFIPNRLGIILESAPIAIFCLVTKAEGQMFRGIPGFYSTSGAVIFCAHLVAVKCEVFTTTSTREIQLCAGPATQLTRSSPTSGKSRTTVTWEIDSPVDGLTENLPSGASSTGYDDTS